jgi:hypothetical protein
MASKPNYNQQRAERSRLKQERKDAKLRALEEGAARRKENREAAPPTAAESVGGPRPLPD